VYIYICESIFIIEVVLVLILNFLDFQIAFVFYVCIHIIWSQIFNNIDEDQH
jgi:hypothetical protein